MNEFLLTLLNMSVVSSFLIVAVLLLRLVLKKAPKAIICILWALVGLRLICPVSFESKLSLVPQKEPVTYIAQQAESDKTVENYESENRQVVIREPSQGTMSIATQSSAEFDFWSFAGRIMPFVWAGGVAMMALSSVISYVRLRRSMLARIKFKNNIYFCDGIKSPFILGVIRPEIYIPSHLDNEEQRVVIDHEKAHIKRLDHIWKPLGFVILAIHWFNPLVWLSYAMLCRDIEGACDEYVVRKMSTDDKKLYSYTLLRCSAPRHMLTACPVAFGEVSVKSRVKSVLSYKKPAFWIIIASVIAVLVLVVLFMTNPVEDKAESFKTQEELIHQVILDEGKSPYPAKDGFLCESHYVFDTKCVENEETYYLWVDCEEYVLEEGKVTSVYGGLGPKVITMTKADNGTYELLEYWEPEDGEGYGDSVREKFPEELHCMVLYGTTHNSVSRETEKKASEHFGVEYTPDAYDQYLRFSGEILSVGDEHYLVAPLEGEEIMGQTIDKVYVYHGGEDEFIEGELILVSYNESIDESYPPYLGSINSITLMIDNFRPEEPYPVEFYRVITENGEKKASATVEATENQLKGIEIYRYSPEVNRNEEKTNTDGGVLVYHESFSPYIYINNYTESASFAYSDGSFITGHFTKTDEGLTIAYNDYYAYINNLGRQKLYFVRTDEGYVLDKEKSNLSDSYRYEIDGRICEEIPSGAVFKNNYDLEVK